MLSFDERTAVEGLAMRRIRCGEGADGAFDSRRCAACAACDGNVTFAFKGGADVVLSGPLVCAANLRRFRRFVFAVACDVPSPVIDIAAAVRETCSASSVWMWASGCVGEPDLWSW